MNDSTIIMIVAKGAAENLESKAEVQENFNQ